MTSRDSRSRPPTRPDSGRDPTQSLEVELEPRHPSLAIGTHEAAHTEHTKVESPGARSRPSGGHDRASSRPPPTPARSDDPDNRLGNVLGSYRLVELLGKGGMGYVYRAEHVKLGREVALKLLRADYARRRDAVLRFFQEAKTVNRVRHRNIVDVTDFVELDDGTTFIIMELLAGTSLGRWARNGVDLPRALAVLVQICDGLGAAHAVGVVHRDLKPDNVVVVPTSDGAELAKLLDFGVAKLVNRDDEDIGFQTAAGSVIGTPAYMSPEQAGGMAVDHRSDIYSLGAIMYELFCGQPMFKGRSFGEYVRKHLTEQPVPPRQTQGGANVDERIERLILKCLAKDPNERFGHILELRDGLLHMLGGVDTYAFAALSGTGMRPMVTGLPSLPAIAQMPTQLTPPAPTPSPSQLSSVYSGYDVAPPPPAGAPWWAWGVGGAIAVALGVVAAIWYAGREPGPAVEATTAPPVPMSTPIEPSPPVQAQVVELRFDSLPSGGVYADGHAAELCRTPCAYNVDLRDGGPTDKRVFVVRSDGYRDRVVEVTLADAQRDFHLTLERDPRAGARQGDPPQTAGGGDHPATRPTKPKQSRRDGHASTSTDKHADTRQADKHADAHQGDKPSDKPSDKPAIKPSDNLEPNPNDKPIAKPTDKPAGKKPGTIDPADTLDPFHRRSP